MNTNRIIFLDYLRVIACFMVMVVHSCEPFYLGGEGTLILSQGDAMWVTLVDSAFRASVPLFVLASSYLLFPLRGEVSVFFRKRVRRVVVPFVFWSIMYAVIPLYGEVYEFYKAGDILSNLQQLFFNFVGSAGHLWFVYMLLGVYLVMPLLSPWVEKVSRKGEEVFLALWAVTTILPFLRHAAMLHSGLAEVWGEANWNEFGTFYGVSGFVGYLVLGHYLRTYHSSLSFMRTVAIAVPCLILGYAITAIPFYAAIPKVYPVSDSIDLAVRMELTWRFCSTGPALMAVGYFMLIRRITCGGIIYDKIIRPISSASYGMYLVHIFILCFMVVVLRQHISSTPVVILLTAVSTYVCSFVFVKLLSIIPFIGRHISGCN